MAESLKRLRIFTASPSDVASERARLQTVVDSLKVMANGLGLTLEVVDWRAVLPDAGRPQQVIFDQLKPTSWDIFIGILWHRFGTPPGAKDKTGKEYLSGTEEEFKTAYELWEQHGKPRIMLYRCMRALPYDVDADQLKHVRDFFKLIEDVKGDHPALYQAFETTKSFEKLLLHNLHKLLIEYSEHTKTPISPEVIQVLAPKIPNNLPRRQAFFGRAKEMETVTRALNPADRTWGVLVDGIGGIGKSAIAVEAAYRAQESRLFEAFVFVTAKQNILEPSGIRELNPPAHTLDEFLNETGRVLGQPGIAKLTGDEKRRALIDVLRSTYTLLIYDNLETLSKEEQEAVADFLRELPQGCKAIITSRRRGGEGSMWLRLGKLDWDAARGIIENEMSRDAGLANKLSRVISRWQELYDETNGSPLTLVHTLGLLRVRATLSFDAALEMLRGDRDTDLQTFIFQEARKELTTNDKRALGALSFFESPATYEAWMQVANLSRNALETTIDRLSALSLVDILIGDERYTLHPLTRAFVRNELHADANLVHKTGMRYANYWLGYIKQYGSESNNSTPINRLDVERANLDAAVQWLQETAARDRSAADMILDMQNALDVFVSSDEHWNDDVKSSAQQLILLLYLYVFTPRGDIIKLPIGSTPIDFAYHVHTDIGHRCRGARINGKLAPLYQELKTGDQVEILTAQRGGPSRDWLNPNLGLVKTQRARSKIKAWFKRQEDEQNLSQGRATLQRELQRLDITSVNFEKMARELGFKIPEEMFIALGNGDLSVNKVIKELSEIAGTADILEATVPAQETKPSTDAVEVVGLKGLLSTMARCCNPMPGDPIVGYITRGRGATIHRQDCPNILRVKDKERLLQVDWGQVERTFPVAITVKAYDRQGLTGDISTLLQNEGVNIADVSVNYNRTMADIKLVIEIRDLAQLSRVLTRIESLPNVLEATRIRPK